MDNLFKLTEKVLLVADRKQILSIYPYRDTNAARITEKTCNALIVGYDAPSTSKTQVVTVVEKALVYIEKVVSRRKETVNVFPSS
jgi:DNA/RNA-binding domain of Phe-tRNA-synthetase-like protein